MRYVVTANGSPDYFDHRVSVGDVVKFELDFGPWLEDKGTIDSTVWTSVFGSAGIVDTDQEALITFNSAGRNLISCLVTTSTGEAKKVWLTIKAVDRNCPDDYGFNN